MEGRKVREKFWRMALISFLLIIGILLYASLTIDRAVTLIPLGLPVLPEVKVIKAVSVLVMPSLFGLFELYLSKFLVMLILISLFYLLPSLEK